MLNTVLKASLVIGFMLSLSVTSKAINYEIVVDNEQVKTNISGFLDATSFDCKSVVSPVSRQHQEIKSLVQSAAQPFGYFNTEVEISVPKNTNCESINLTISLGSITTLNQVSIKLLDTEDQELQGIVSNHPMKPGSAFKQAQYEKLKSDLLNVASEKFYLDAKFVEQRIDVFAETNQADIVLTFVPGQRYQISDIDVEFGRPFLSQDLIDKLVTIETQKEITQSDLFKLKQQLNSYGYFGQVLFEIGDKNQLNATVPLIIKFTPAAKYDYSVGIGFSTDKGAKASFKYNNYRINNRGHQLKAQLNLSEVTNELITDYKIPSDNRPASHWYNIQLGYQDEKNENIESQTSKLGLSETRIIRGRWQNINFIDILHESFDTGVEKGEAFLVVPGVSWSLTDADNVARPDNGYKIQTDLKGASEDVLSDASFLQFSVKGKYIHTIGESNRLLYRAHLGATATSDLNELPTTYRYFAGGDQSIRGYDYESISPINESGDLVGGKHLIVGSVEFEHQFAPQWAVAAFTDFGDSFSDDLDLKFSVGAGLRWFSPIGPVRVDVGIPMNDDENDFRFHITVGPDL